MSKNVIQKCNAIKMRLLAAKITTEMHRQQKAPGLFTSVQLKRISFGHCAVQTHFFCDCTAQMHFFCDCAAQTHFFCDLAAQTHFFGRKMRLTIPIALFRKKMRRARTNAFFRKKNAPRADKCIFQSHFCNLRSKTLSQRIFKTHFKCDLRRQTHFKCDLSIKSYFFCAMEEW